MGCHGRPWVPMGDHGLPMGDDQIATDDHALSQTPMAFPWVTVALPLLTMAFPWLTVGLLLLHYHGCPWSSVALLTVVRAIAMTWPWHGHV